MSFSTASRSLSRSRLLQSLYTFWRLNENLIRDNRFGSRPLFVVSNSLSTLQYIPFPLWSPKLTVYIRRAP
jgi:hypothetical protein